jgi:uncharacterized protein YqjF (DUF2071 family)
VHLPQMHLPQMQGRIERRLLVSYRADPDVVARLLPSPFRPQLVNNRAVVGICLLRLGELRPRGVPPWAGLRSENAAHRIAVEWDGPDGPQVGVYIPRRDSASIANVVVGGRLYPGEHRRAEFRVAEAPDELRVAFRARDASAAVDVHVRIAPTLSGSELFADLDQASAFFRAGCAGYSATRDGDRLDGLELRATGWAVDATEIVSVRSSFFADARAFPPGSAELDCALVMRDVPVEWRALPSLRSAPAALAG